VADKRALASNVELVLEEYIAAKKKGGKRKSEDTCTAIKLKATK